MSLPSPFRTLRLGLSIALVVALADQASKWYVMERLMRPEGVEGTPFQSFRSIEILPVLHLVTAWNHGIAFSVGNNDGSWNALIFSAISIVVVAGLIIWLRRAEEGLLRFALGLIIGGALGNLVDRARFGAVADFIFFHVGNFRWPAFNLADSAICVGAGLLLFQSLFGHSASLKNRP